MKHCGMSTRSCRGYLLNKMALPETRLDGEFEANKRRKPRSPLPGRPKPRNESAARSTPERRRWRASQLVRGGSRRSGRGAESALENLPATWTISVGWTATTPGSWGWAAEVQVISAAVAVTEGSAGTQMRRGRWLFLRMLTLDHNGDHGKQMDLDRCSG